MHCIVFPLGQHIDGLVPPCEGRADSCRLGQGSRSDSVKGKANARCRTDAYLFGGRNTDSVVQHKPGVWSEAKCMCLEWAATAGRLVRWQGKQLAGRKLGPTRGLTSTPPPAWPTGGRMQLCQHCAYGRMPASPATITVLTSSRVCRSSLSILCSVRSPQGCRKAHSMPWIQTYLSRDDLKYHSAHQAGTTCSGWSTTAGREAISLQSCCHSECLHCCVAAFHHEDEQTDLPQPGADVKADNRSKRKPDRHHTMAGSACATPHHAAHRWLASWGPHSPCTT